MIISGKIKRILTTPLWPKKSALRLMSDLQAIRIIKAHLSAYKKDPSNLTPLIEASRLGMVEHIIPKVASKLTREWLKLDKKGIDSPPAAIYLAIARYIDAQKMILQGNSKEGTPRLLASLQSLENICKSNAEPEIKTETYFVLGMLYQANEMTGKALVAYSNAWRLCPENIKARVAMALLYLDQYHDPDNALSIIQPLLSKDDKNFEVLNTTVGIYLGKKLFDQAYNSALKLIKLYPYEPEGLITMGTVRVNQGYNLRGFYWYWKAYMLNLDTNEFLNLAKITAYNAYVKLYNFLLQILFGEQ